MGFGHAKRDFQQQITKTYKIYKNTEYIPFDLKPKEIQNENHQDQNSNRPPILHRQTCLRLGFGFSLGFAFCFRFTLGFGLPLGLEGMSNDGEEIEEEAQIMNKQNVGYTYYYYILYHLNW